MKKQAALIVIVLLCTLPTLSRAQAGIKLRASTVAAVKPGVTGSFDTTSPTQLIFHPGGNGQPDLVMPYATISAYSSEQRDAFHTGVLAAIVVGLFIPRPKVHLLNVSYKDASDITQVLTFELPKNVPELLLPLLQVRATSACHNREFGACAASPERVRKALAPEAVSLPAPNPPPTVQASK